MNVLVLGGHGRLGRRLVPELLARGHAVDAPTRENLCATNEEDVLAAIHGNPFGVDVVVSLVAATDVPGCERDPRNADWTNHRSAAIVADACRGTNVQFLWTSTDYVLAGGPTPAEPEPDPMSFARLGLLPPGSRVYAETKNRGEAAVVRIGGTSARVAFCDPDDAAKWAWVDGYGLASREWVERTAKRIAILTEIVAAGTERGKIVHVGPIQGVDAGRLGCWRTHRSLLADRFPDHPALRRVAWTPAQRRAFGGNDAPGDTRFASCDPRLALDPG